MKIAVVGAPGTGRTTLVQALRLALAADADIAECSVSEDWAPGQPCNSDLTLLMGNDLPQRERETTLQSDAHLRHTLNSQSIPYAVVYGSSQARTDCALQAIAYHRQQARTRPRRAASDWQWCCDTCSDAACEHRMFTALVNDKQQPPVSVRP